MITPAQVMQLAASDMNDTARTNYTNEALLPYFNMAVEELFQVMEENNIPITNKSSAAITCPAGITEIPYYSTTQPEPLLPADLIEIEKIWESNDGGTNWTQLQQVDTIDPNIAYNQNISSFGMYKWMGTHIQVPQSTTDILLRIDYIRRIITIPMTIEQIGIPLPTQAILFLAHKTAALCAMLSAQNETRAGACAELASQALERELNIPTKGRQTIATRRRPFRMNYKFSSRTW